MTPWSGVLMLGRSHISYYSEYVLSSNLSIYSTLIAIVLGIMMLLSYTMVDFHLFYDGAVDIQIWALLTRSQCKASDTQVTVKACWPLFFSNLFAGTYLVDISLQFVVETTEWRGINQSILTLWVTQVIYYTGFTLQLCLIECWYPDIRFSDFFVIAFLPTVWR